MGWGQACNSAILITSPVKGRWFSHKRRIQNLFITFVVNDLAGDANHGSARKTRIAELQA
jgi:hypothetical protein